MLVTVAVSATATQTTFDWGNDFNLVGARIWAIQMINNGVTFAPDGSNNIGAALFAAGFLSLVAANGNDILLDKMPFRYLDPQTSTEGTLMLDGIVISPSKCKFIFATNTLYAANAGTIMANVFYDDAQDVQTQ